MRIIAIATLTVTVVAALAADTTLTNDQIADAIAVGLKAKGKHQGLILKDSGQGFMNALTQAANDMNRYNYNRTTIGSTGFWLEAFTPLTWIQQLASAASKEYRTMTPEDVTDTHREDVFRVLAHPDTPNEVTAKGMVGSSGVQHVVLRSGNREVVIQPLKKTDFTEDAANAMGAKFTYGGVVATFPMEGLRELRGPKGDREFFITVIGSTGEEKNFKVKQKHFSELK